MTSGFLARAARFESGISGLRQPSVGLSGWFGGLSCCRSSFPSNVLFFTAFSHVPCDARWNSLHDDELFGSSSAPNYDNAEQMVWGSGPGTLCLMCSNHVLSFIGQNKSVFDLFTKNLNVALSNVILRIILEFSNLRTKITVKNLLRGVRTSTEKMVEQ